MHMLLIFIQSITGTMAVPAGALVITPALEGP